MLISSVSFPSSSSSSSNPLSFFSCSFLCVSKFDIVSSREEEEEEDDDEEEEDEDLLMGFVM